MTITKSDSTGLESHSADVRKTAALEFGSAWDYAPAPETPDHVQIDPKYGLFIGGRWVTPAERQVLPDHQPQHRAGALRGGRGQRAGRRRRREGGARGLRQVLVEDARRDRAKYIFRIARAIQEKARELAIVESMDGGKPIKESRDVDVPLAAAHFFYHAGWADKLDYAFQGRRHRPLGVAGQIIPWNFPLLMAAWKIAPALACGNTVVLKPAETTPLTALLLAKIIEEAELPPGVVNIVTGAGETGAALVNHPDVNKIAFTGSTDGRQEASSAPSPARTSASRSSSAARRRTSSSPTRRSIRRSTASSTASTSTRATSAARARASSSRRACTTLIVKKLRDRMATLRLGDPLDKNTDVGAINSQDAARDASASSSTPARKRAASATARRAASPRRASGSRPRSSPARACRAASRARRSSGRSSPS